ncbi:MAG TPA: hypothetical protein VGB77_04955 [Abditibacteriaceae bacterium]|jgi:hypothetical protein
MAREQDKTYDTDRLETASAGGSDTADDTSNFPLDSPTSASDAGLDDALLEETGDDLSDAELLEDDLNAADSEFADEDGNPRGIEIPMSDIEMEPDALSAPEMSDLNLPGEIDIEELDEHALDNTDLPADARLDPIEE